MSSQELSAFRRNVLELGCASSALKGYHLTPQMGVIQNKGYPLFRGPDNKDYSILVSILGSPDFGKLPNYWLLENNLSGPGRELRLVRSAPH